MSTAKSNPKLCILSFLPAGGEGMHVDLIFEHLLNLGFSQIQIATALSSLVRKKHIKSTKTPEFGTIINKSMQEETPKSTTGNQHK